MRKEDLLSKSATGRNTTTAQVVFKATHAKKKIVFGEVYAPEIVDSHGDVMSHEELEKLAHKFLLDNKTNNIDAQHNNVKLPATAVESFIARKGDPDFTEGSWVLGVKIHSDKLWKEIESGKYNGYSMEIYTLKEERLVEVSILPQVFGKTENSNGHSHYYYVKVDNNGKIVSGRTSEDDGHYHVIDSSSSTEKSDNHSHRYFLL